VSIPTFDGDTLVGIYGVHFDLIVFFTNLMDPMLGEDDYIMYWAYPAGDLLI
jgi:hypothetical protein